MIYYLQFIVEEIKAMRGQMSGQKITLPLRCRIGYRDSDPLLAVVLKLKHVSESSVKTESLIKK